MRLTPIPCTLHGQATPITPRVPQTPAAASSGASGDDIDITKLTAPPTNPEDPMQRLIVDVVTGEVGVVRCTKGFPSTLFVWHSNVTQCKPSVAFGAPRLWCICAHGALSMSRLVQVMSVQSILAALLCQRGRLLAIAHSSNGQWYVADTACPVHICINISMRIVAVSQYRGW